MNLYGIPEQLQQGLYDAITATGFVKHTRPGAGANLEFSHHTLDKLQAVTAVLEALGISYEEALAIGDSTNDLPMFEVAAHTVCMGEGMEEAKAAAEYVTDSVLGDGVEKALRHFGLV